MAVKFGSSRPQHLKILRKCDPPSDVPIGVVDMRPGFGAAEKVKNLGSKICVTVRNEAQPVYLAEIVGNNAIVRIADTCKQLVVGMRCCESADLAQSDEGNAQPSRGQTRVAAISMLFQPNVKCAWVQSRQMDK